MREAITTATCILPHRISPRDSGGPYFAALVTLGTEAAGATDPERATLVAAASYASAVLASRLFPAYVLLVPALGVLLIGMVMVRGAFSRAAGYLGVLAGVVGTVTTFGGFVSPAYEVFVIPTALLTTLWFFVVGYRLLGVAQTGSMRAGYDSRDGD